MSGQDGEKSSDESKSTKSGEEIDDPQKALLEEEIKKIISGFDVKFEESTPEDEDGVATVMGSSTVPTSLTVQPLTNWGERETPQMRAESASTVSGATTVVHHLRVPPKVTSSHVRSEPQDWPRSPRSQMPIFGHHQTPYADSPNVGLTTGMQEHEFYHPERDEITEQTTTSETLVSTLESTTYGHTTPSTQMPSSIGQTLRHGVLPPLAEETSGLLRHQPLDQNILLRQMQGSRFPQDNHAAAQDQTQQYSVNHQGYAQQTVDMASPPRMNQTDPGSHQPYQTEYQPRLPEYQPRLPEYKSQYQPEYSPPYNQSPPANNQTQQMKEKIDRYNSTHISYSPVKESEKPRRSLTDYFLAKSRNMFRRGNDSDSGEVVPQLYKATIKNGTTPARFTFKAVTGCQPPPCTCCRCTGRTPYYGGYADPQACYDMQYMPMEMRKECCPPCPPPVPPCNLCCCTEPLDSQLERKKSAVRLKKTCPTGNCEVTSLPPKDGVKTKAYYTDLGCGYISQSSVPEKVDIYCFDQLNTGFFRTSDHPPPLFADIAVQRTEKYSTVFWAEIFGVANVVTAFLIAMILQTFKFVLQGILRPILIGFVQLLSDYLIKPLLTLLYNGFTQPISIFLYNVIASLRDIMQPLAKGLGFFVELIAVVLRAIRLVEVKNVTNITPCGPQPVKY